jgi:hypothetical protein
MSLATKIGDFNRKIICLIFYLDQRKRLLSAQQIHGLPDASDALGLSNGPEFGQQHD